MDNIALNKLQEILGKSQNIGIVAPKNPNIDQMGAALGLYLSLSKTGKQVTVATPEDPLVEVSSLIGIDKVKTALGGATGDLVVSFPYKTGEIEKVSYTLEDGFLNIVVKAGESGLSFEQKDVKYLRPQGGPELLFIVGARRLSDLGKLFDPSDLKDTTVVNIDNAPDNQGFGDIVMVSTKFSSISEQIANLILSENLPMDQDIAQNLFSGISFATDNFQNPRTSSMAFEMAGVLMRNGAQRESQTRERRTTAFSRSQVPVANQQFEPTPVKQSVPSVQSQTKVEQAQKEDQTLNNPPSDWLAPKIYKGSTNF